jgi:hypothetical protein
VTDSYLLAQRLFGTQGRKPAKSHFWELFMSPPPTFTLCSIPRNGLEHYLHTHSGLSLRAQWLSRLHMLHQRASHVQQQWVSFLAQLTSCIVAFQNSIIISRASFPRLPINRIVSPKYCSTKEARSQFSILVDWSHQISWAQLVTPRRGLESQLNEEPSQMYVQTDPNFGMKTKFHEVCSICTRAR